MGNQHNTLVVVAIVQYVLSFSMVTSNACSSRCTSTAQNVVHTCTDALAQIKPTCVYETDPAGTCLLSLATNSSLILEVSVTNPPELVNRLDGYFQLNANNATHAHLELQTPLDVETVYLNTNITSTDIQLTISCTNDSLTTESGTLNLTIVDDDDNGPSFSQSADSTCLVPAFTASAHEDYIGPLTTHPSCMCASDGDFVTNNDIILSFLYGNPPDFSKFFAVDMLTNTINKTSNLSSNDPREYTFIIQATENSSLGRSMVAVLSVGIESGYPSVTMTEHKANESVKLVLQLLSAVILVGFSIGFVILIWHRNRRVNPVIKQTDKKQSVIKCFKSTIKDENPDTENKPPCAKRTEWTLESIEEEPDQMLL